MRIEELATRTLRTRHPGLASEWDAQQQAQRLHEQLLGQNAEQQGLHRRYLLQSARCTRLGLSQHGPHGHRRQDRQAACTVHIPQRCLLGKSGLHLTSS